MRISDWSSDVCAADHLVDIALDRRRRLLDGAGALEFIELLRVRKLLRGGAAFLEDGDHLFEFGVELGDRVRSEEHTSELQSLMRISYAVFCLKKKKHVLEREVV